MFDMFGGNKDEGTSILIIIIGIAVLYFIIRFAVKGGVIDALKEIIKDFKIPMTFFNAGANMNNNKHCI